MNTDLKQTLKARAHHLKPIILLGAKGLTEAVIAEADIALNAHELIKIKLTGVERDDKKAITESICQQLRAELVQSIGNIIVIYRENKE